MKEIEFLGFIINPLQPTSVKVVKFCCYGQLISRPYSGFSGHLIPIERNQIYDELPTVEVVYNPQANGLAERRMKPKIFS
jgi:hypothetical protein